MPIDCSVEILGVDQERFHAMDRLVMHHVFDIHNTLGRFCDERIYQDELAVRCCEDGLDCQREPSIRVSLRDFSKTYLCLLDPESAWHLSAVKTSLKSHETHIRRLIQHTRLKRVHWINLNNREITLKTIQK